MAPNRVSNGPPATVWTEAEKAELVEYYKFCIEQRDKCIENVEAIYQEQKDLEALHQKQKTEGKDDGDSDDARDQQAQYDELARRAADQVTLMEGYIDILIVIEAEMEASGLSIP